MFKSSLIHFTTLLLLFFALSNEVLAQSTATISGTLKDEDNQGIDFATVAAIGIAGGTSTDILGNYSLEIPSGVDIKLSFSHVRFEQQTFLVNLKAGQTKKLNRILKIKENLIDEAVVADDVNRSSTMQRVDPRIAMEIPTVGGGIEAVLKTFPGVSSNNELSSQYNVRGGNYDENLVYVNDIEIYRPFLVRSGQQEGLSFINPDLV
ncbi:MAG: hypothetical protein ACI8VL_002260, partial [Bacteroidia bacterium]